MPSTNTQERLDEQMIEEPFSDSLTDSLLWQLNSQLRQASREEEEEKRGDLSKVEAIFEQIARECEPDSYSLAVFLKCLASHRCFDKAFQLQQRIQLNNWQADEYFYTSIIDLYASCEQPELAWSAANQMANSGLIPTSAVLSLLFERFYSPNDTQQQKQTTIERCCKLLQPFVPPEPSRTLVRVFAYLSDDQPDLALSSLLLAADSGAANAIDSAVCSRVIRAVSAAGIEATISALQSLADRRLQIDQSAAIAVSLRFLRCTREGEGERPQLVRGAEPPVQLCLFDGLCACGFAPNVYLCNSIINAQVSARNYDGAVRLFDEMAAGKYSVAPDIRTFNILIKMHKQRGDEEAVVKIVAAMGAAGVDPDLVSYNELLSFYGLKGDIDRMRQIWQFIRAAGVQPDQITYSTTITALGKAGLVHEAEIYFADMKSAGIRPNLVSYTTMLQMYRVYNDVASAQRTFNEMLATGVQPDEVVCRTYRNILLKSGLQKQADEVNSIIRRLPSHNRPTARSIRGAAFQHPRSVRVVNN